MIIIIFVAPYPKAIRRFTIKDLLNYELLGKVTLRSQTRSAQKD